MWEVGGRVKKCCVADAFAHVHIRVTNCIPHAQRIGEHNLVDIDMHSRTRPHAHSQTQDDSPVTRVHEQGRGPETERAGGDRDS